jgi:hypothetical protein
MSAVHPSAILVAPLTRVAPLASSAIPQDAHSGIVQKLLADTSEEILRVRRDDREEANRIVAPSGSHALS